MSIGLAIVVGYVLGSIPVGLLVSRLAGGVDVRDYGSGKTGFTNSLRVLGLRRSVPVFLGDFGKGALAAEAAPDCMPTNLPVQTRQSSMPGYCASHASEP